MDSTNSQSQAATTANNHRHLYNHSATAAATMHMGRSMLKISQVYGGNLIDIKDKLM
jgi:hypothetical protein